MDNQPRQNAFEPKLDDISKTTSILPAVFTSKTPSASASQDVINK